MSKEESPDELLEEINQARDNIKKLSVIAKDIDPDNLCLHLTYLSTQKLRKHSKTLNFWTKVIAGTAIVMILVAIAQVWVMINFS